MIVTKTELPGVLLIQPDVYADERGYFQETWNSRRFRAAGIPAVFVQDNISFSSKGVLRGLHVQHPGAQGKLIHVSQGEVFDVVVDVRPSSPTFGRSVSCALSSENHLQLYVPEGFAHGFCVLGEGALFAYKCTEEYNPRGELTIRWDDPELGIDWPIENPIVSKKDRQGLCLMDIDPNLLPDPARSSA